MTSMFRTAASACLLTIACASVAHAFPPCPIDEAGILPLNEPPPASILAMSPWKVATVSAIGDVTPESITVDCNRISSIIKSGECKVDSFDLRGLPAQTSLGTIGAKPSYSTANRIGLAGLPDVRNEDVATHKPVYALRLGINATPLAHPGDWIDIAQVEFEAGTGAKVTPGATYRLRKVTRPFARPELRLILASGDTTRDIVVAAVPLGTKSGVVDVSLRWSPAAEVVPGQTENQSIGTQPIELQPPSVDTYTVSTSLALDVDGTTVYATTLTDQMPSIASMGVLDYNLPYALDDGATGLADARDTLADPSIESMEALDQLQQADEPGSLLIFYYTQFAVHSK